MQTDKPQSISLYQEQWYEATVSQCLPLDPDTAVTTPGLVTSPADQKMAFMVNYSLILKLKYHRLLPPYQYTSAR